MVSIRVTARGFKNNTQLLRDLITGQDETLERLFHQLGLDISDDARHTLQQNGNINTGALHASVRILEEDPGKSMSVGSDVPYAEYIEFGRGPITAEEGKVLHFISKTTGEDVFTKRVKAVEPMPFLQPAVEKHSRKFSDVYAEENELFIKKRATSLLDTELLD